jgi:hypothetical protein
MLFNRIFPFLSFLVVAGASSQTGFASAIFSDLSGTYGYSSIGFSSSNDETFATGLWGCRGE